MIFRVSDFCILRAIAMSVRVTEPLTIQKTILNSQMYYYNILTLNNISYILEVKPDVLPRRTRVNLLGRRLSDLCRCAKINKRFNNPKVKENIQVSIYLNTSHTNYKKQKFRNCKFYANCDRVCKDKRSITLTPQLRVCTVLPA